MIHRQQNFAVKGLACTYRQKHRVRQPLHDLLKRDIVQRQQLSITCSACEIRKGHRQVFNQPCADDVQHREALKGKI